MKNRRSSEIKKLSICLWILFLSVALNANYLFANDATSDASHPCKKICGVMRGDTFSKEVNRIRTCLTCMARDPWEEEERIYRWGHPIQIETFFSASSTEEYHDYIYSSQNKREQTINQEWIKTWGKKLLGEIDACFGEAACYNSLNHKINMSRDLEDLYILGQWDDRNLPVIYKLLVWERIYPGFIRSFESDPKREYQFLQRYYRKSTRTMRQEGTLLGLYIYNNADAKKVKKSAIGNSDRSFMTWGRGSYFAMNPIDSIAHYEKDYKGLSCSVNGKKLINVDHKTDQGMINLRLLYNSKIIHGYCGSYLPEMKTGANSDFCPVGKNKYLYPMAFETAAKDFIIRFTSTSGTSVVAKARATQKSNCRLLDAADVAAFSTCELLPTLFEKGIQNGLFNYLGHVHFDKSSARDLAVIDKKSLESILDSIMDCYIAADTTGWKTGSPARMKNLLSLEMGFEKAKDKLELRYLRNFLSKNGDWAGRDIYVAEYKKVFKKDSIIETF